ncbi:MAG: hypothetical protein QXY15_04530 [Candidatus Nitrosotenuis sp.]
MSQSQEHAVVVLKEDGNSIDTIEVNALGIVCELMYAIPLIIRQISHDKRKEADGNKYSFSLMVSHLLYTLKQIYEHVFKIASNLPNKRESITVAECSLFEIRSIRRWIDALTPVYGDSAVDVVYNDEARYQMYTPSYVINLCDELNKHLENIISEKTRSYVESESSAPRRIQVSTWEKGNV